jgi:hypothetical protein
MGGNGVTNGQNERVKQLEEKLRTFRIKHHLQHRLWKENPEEAYRKFLGEVQEFKALISELRKALDFYSYRTTVNELAIQSRVLRRLLPGGEEG